jgi:ABC-type transporter Mla maintaining outer membrane lipid asymmetry ATPase subunit MlaF
VTGRVLELTGVSKNYRGLRPLRLEYLSVAAGEQIAILGLDQVAAEVFVNLVTGTILPDRGDVKVFGRSTASIQDSTEWLQLLDRFGIVSERAVLLDAFSVAQNLAVPFTLEIEPPPDDVLRKIETIAREVDLPESTWDLRVGDLDAAARARVRLGRALALDPAVLLLEHATVNLPSTEAAALGRQIRAVTTRRGSAMIAATADGAFASGVADRTLTLDPASGRLTRRRGSTSYRF